MSNRFNAPVTLGKRRLFLDLDGVMADFDRHFRDLFGVESKDQADDALWAAITSSPIFFRSMPVCPDAIEFFEAIRHLNPMILTACPKSDYANVATQKRQWVREHLSEDILVLPTPGGTAKPLFMHQPGDVLIDDFVRNCAAWTDHGGVAIRHTAFGSTANMLWAMEDWG